MGRILHGRGQGAPVALAEIFAELVGAGFGADHDDLGRRLTWRQLERYYRLTLRARRRARADLTEAVSMGFGGKDLAGYLKKLMDSNE